MYLEALSIHVYDFWLLVEELIQSRGNICMMLSHPPRCLKGIPSSNKKHVGSLKYVGCVRVWCIIRKPYVRMSLNKYPEDTFDTFLQLQCYHMIQNIKYNYCSGYYLVNLCTLVINQILCGTKW